MAPYALRKHSRTAVGRNLATSVHAALHLVCSHWRGVARGHLGALDTSSLMLIAASTALGALARRWLSGFGANPFSQSLGAALIAGIVGVVSALNSHQQIETALVAFCPCMVQVPGAHLLNGAIDRARTRIVLGIARLTYAGIIVLMICFGLLSGLTAGGAALPAASVPLLADVIAAGCAVASFGIAKRP